MGAHESGDAQKSDLPIFPRDELTDRGRGGCEADGVMSVAAERPYPRPPQMNADREAGRDCVLSAELVTAKRITVQLLKVSQRC
jgi:hypothetical protein